MPPPVYSDNFISEPGVIGDYHHGGVPEQTIFVVKCISFYCDYAIGPVIVHFKNFSSGATLRAWYGPLQDSPALVPISDAFYGQFVFLPGEDFGWSVTSPDNAAADVHASGFYFSLP